MISQPKYPKTIDIIVWIFTEKENLIDIRLLHPSLLFFKTHRYTSTHIIHIYYFPSNSRLLGWTYRRALLNQKHPKTGVLLVQIRGTVYFGKRITQPWLIVNSNFKRKFKKRIPLSLYKNILFEGESCEFSLDHSFSLEDKVLNRQTT